MAKLTPVGKVSVLVIVVAAAFGVYQAMAKSGKLGEILPEAKSQGSNVPPTADLPSMDDSGSGGGSMNVSMPSGGGGGCTNLPEVRFLHWAWSAQLGAMFANGGRQSTAGSLMCENGVNLRFIRQDDPSKMQEELVTFATGLKQGQSNPSNGAHYVAIMGDGAAAFLAGVNPTLRRLGPEYQAKVVGTIGFSRGEDKFMGLPEWKTNPLSSRGGVVAGYLRDGDWNIALKWLGDNGLKNNPDEKTWDPDALNWVAANDYIDAAEKYIAGYSETRPVVRNGRRTGETKRITVNGVVTWTPGDVTVAEKKGGLVSIVSTREYASQMPCTIIGIDAWMKKNRPSVEGMLTAMLRGGEAVKGSREAFTRATEIAADVFGEQGAGPEYWAKYFPGVTQRDKQGLEVELGGSSVNGVAEAMATFGLVPGSANVFATTYTVFGDVAKSQYPELMPTYPPVSQILDTSYLKNVASRNRPSRQDIAKAAPTPVKPAGGGSLVRVSRKIVRIPFETGRAVFSSAAQSPLRRLREDLLVASGTNIEVHGHTDNVGDPSANMKLSEDRAFAVKRWLNKNFPYNFPEGRISVFAHGAQNPLVPNSTPKGRATNRRVEVVLTASQ
jgi:outer membrane protein OmpA-like peptidoglycan-associated protein